MTPSSCCAAVAVLKKLSAGKPEACRLLWQPCAVKAIVALPGPPAASAVGFGDRLTFTSKPKQLSCRKHVAPHAVQCCVSIAPWQTALQYKRQAKWRRTHMSCWRASLLHAIGCGCPCCQSSCYLAHPALCEVISAGARTLCIGCLCLSTKSSCRLVACCEDVVPATRSMSMLRRP